MGRYEDLERLQELKEQGALTDEEFQQEKQRLLNTPEPPPAPVALPGLTTPPPPPSVISSAPPIPGAPAGPWGMTVQVYCMLLHLSQFAGFIVPFLGLALPVVMWALNKDEYPEVDAHGRVILNWMLSGLIYFAVFFVLLFLLIGFPLMAALAICSIVFTIIGAIKANEGTVWKYPMSIRFF